MEHSSHVLSFNRPKLKGKTFRLKGRLAHSSDNCRVPLNRVKEALKSVQVLPPGQAKHTSTLATVAKLPSGGAGVVVCGIGGILDGNKGLLKSNLPAG